MIYVDADACPVREETMRVATRHRVPVKMVCDGGIRPSANPLVEVVIVAQGADAADDWIAERVAPGDLVISADIPLADRCVKAGAEVLKPDGTVLDATTIGPALATRDLMADLRSADPFRQGGGKAFTKADRSRFLNAMENALRRASSKRTTP